MASDLHLSCNCGKFHAVLKDTKPQRGIRLRCYCRDCQTYAQYLGSADRSLDEHGGTDLFQTSPRGLGITKGREHLACLRLSPKGPLRWYASCCNSAIANTVASAKVPFVAIQRSACADDVDALIGPTGAAIYAAHARSRPKSGRVYNGLPRLLTLRIVAQLLMAKLRGEQHQSPFFDENGTAVVTPEILTREARAEAQARI